MLVFWRLQGQTPCTINALNGTLPTKCLEIESVLVNACTNSEGYDEMARIKIGPNAILLSNLTTVKWATANPWQGWAIWDATNLAKLVTINNLIQSAGNCGKVIKVNPSDIIPAYSNLLIITSTLFDEYAQDFSGLIDTMYVAIQNNQTVLSGHFSNQTNSTKQTFILGTSSCSDTVSFYGNQMVKANGAFGSENGSSVEFTFNGTAKYFNNGCKIPQQTLKVDAGTVNSQYCQGDTVHLTGSNSGAKCSWWYPENRSSGVFSDSTLNSTYFVISKAYLGNIKLYFKIVGNCGKYLIDSVEFSINSGSGLIALKPNSSVKWCVLNPILITAEVTDTNLLTWEHDGYGTLLTNDSISKYYFPSPADTSGVHIIIKQPSLCRLRTDTLFIDFINKPKAEFIVSDSIICKGLTTFVKLTPKNIGGVFSGTGVSGNLFIPDTSGVYTIKYLLDIGGCKDSVYHKVYVLNKPDASFTLSDSVICTGEETINLFHQIQQDIG